MRFYKKHSNDIKVMSKNDTSLIIKEANCEVERAGKVISELAASSLAIGKIIDILGSIKERTGLEKDLLERSDVASKGIRQLAGETENAIKAVSNNISLIQENFVKAIIIIQEIVEVTKKVNDISNSIAAVVEENPDIDQKIRKNKNNILSDLINIIIPISDRSVKTEEYFQMGLNLKSSAENLRYLTQYLENNVLADIKNNLKSSLAL
jgi:methyl-accepting chemotaxis protein